jgi:hypothetical protein
VGDQVQQLCDFGLKGVFLGAHGMGFKKSEIKKGEMVKGRRFVENRHCEERSDVAVFA